MDFNILGVGIPELIVIFVLLLVVAGPKRMVQWAYVIGQYVAKGRVMFQEAMEAVKREIDAEGLTETINEVRQLKNEIPTVPNVNSKINELKKAEQSWFAGAQPINANNASLPAAGVSSAANASAATLNTTSENTGEPPAGITDTDTTATEADNKGSRYDAWIPK